VTAAAVLLAFAAGDALAEPVASWVFETESFCVGRTDEVTVYGVVSNDPAATEPLSIWHVTAGGGDGTPPAGGLALAEGYDVQLASLLFFQAEIVPPGESRRFPWASLTPRDGAVAPGIYGPAEATFDLGSTVLTSSNLFTVTVVPSGKCLDNSQCEAPLYCARSEGECGGAGTCNLRPDVCIYLYEPVCACDGRTYGNDCEAAAAGTSVAYRGECKPACMDDTQCQPGDYCARPAGRCNGPGVCSGTPHACPCFVAPVCGCDGVTYGNSCEAAAVGVSVADPGACDEDGDGVPDGADNCTDLANPTQVDTDGDGIGNACDCDLNQDNFCGGPDFTLFIGCFNQPTGGDATCEAADMNGDGFVGGPDFTLFIGGFNGPPGPAAP